MGRVSLEAVDVMHIVDGNQNQESTRLMELAKPYGFRIVEHPFKPSS